MLAGDTLAGLVRVTATWAVSGRVAATRSGTSLGLGSEARAWIEYPSFFTFTRLSQGSKAKWLSICPDRVTTSNRTMWPRLYDGSMASYVRPGLDLSLTLKAQVQLGLKYFGLVSPLATTKVVLGWLGHFIYPDYAYTTFIAQILVANDSMVFYWITGYFSRLKCSYSHELFIFCSTSSPLTITRWFDQHFQTFHTLSAVD